MSNLINPFRFGAGGDPSITFTWDPENDEALPGGTTFTRASVAEEFDGTDFTQVSSGTIRDGHVPFAGSGKGYIAEPAATNNQTQSSSYSGYSTTNIASRTDDGAGSLGLNQTTVDVGTVDGSHRMFQFIGAGSSGERTGYVIGKEGTGNFITVRPGTLTSTQYAAYNLTTGAATETGSSATSRIIDWADGWYSAEVSVSSVTQRFVVLAFSDTGTPGTSEPSWEPTSDTYLVCHIQDEDTPYATTPIITSGSAGTRVADVLDTGITITTAFSALLDLTLPNVVGTGETITLLGPDATAEDILLVDAANDLIMDDGGTPVTIGAVTPGSRIKVAYGRDASGRSASLDGATAVTGGAPGAGHEGDTFQLGCANSVNQSRSVHHLTTLYNVKKSDAELEALAT